MNERKKKRTTARSVIGVVVLTIFAFWCGVNFSPYINDSSPWEVWGSLNPDWGKAERWATETKDGTAIKLMAQWIWEGEDIETVTSISITTDTDHYYCSVTNGVVEEGDPNIFSAVYDNKDLFQSLSSYMRYEVMIALSAPVSSDSDLDLDST